jgi:YihY family inner membrane protein
MADSSLRHSKVALALIRAVAGKSLRDKLPTFASSLAYTTILSLAPLTAISLSALSSFKGSKTAVTGFIFKWLLPNEELARVIGKNMDMFSANAASVSIFGLITFALIAVWVMGTVESAFNMIWKAPKGRPFFNRFITYWTAITFAPALIAASVAMTASLHSMMASGAIYGHSFSHNILLRVSPYLFTWTAFALAYRLIPNVKVRMAPACTGAFVAGLAFEAAKRGFDYYLRAFAGYEKIYGALSVIPAFLLWLYVTWLIVLLGSALTYIIQHRDELDGGADGSAHLPYHAMSLAALAARDYTDGAAPMSHARAKEKIGMGPELYATVTNALHELDVIEFTDRSGGSFMLKRPPESVKAAPLLMSLVGSGLDTPHAPENGGDETLRLFFEKTRQSALSGADDVTLMTLAKGKDAG